MNVSQERIARCLKKIYQIFSEEKISGGEAVFIGESVKRAGQVLRDIDAQMPGQN